MPEQQLNKRATACLIIAIALIAGPLGWIFLIIWLISQAKNRGLVEPGNVDYSHLDNQQPTQNLSMTAGPLGIKDGISRQGEAGRIILLIVCLIVLIAVVYFYFF